MYTDGIWLLSNVVKCVIKTTYDILCVLKRRFVYV